MLRHRWDLSGNSPVMRADAAMTQNKWELLSERTRAALTAARAKGAVLGGDRGWRPLKPPCAAAAAQARQEEATRTAHRLVREMERLWAEGIVTYAGLARALTKRGVPTPRGRFGWTHTTVARGALSGSGCKHSAAEPTSAVGQEGELRHHSRC